MRILSQDGRIDVPYKQCGFIMFFDESFSGNWDINANIGGNKSYKMAEYSTEEKARKAMEMLREEYTGMPSIRRMDDLYGRFKHTGKKDFELFIEHMVLRKDYFQFPADDEVEV